METAEDTLKIWYRERGGRNQCSIVEQNGAIIEIDIGMCDETR